MANGYVATGYKDQLEDTLVNKFDFYSGSQISVWFGDIFLDDINSIQWVRTQNKTPIYGYASQMFDAVAKGTVLIQGSFMINFRQQGYIPAIVAVIKNLYEEFRSGDPNKKVQNNQSWLTVKNLIALHLQNGTFGPSSAQEIQDLAKNPDFFDLAKEYEKIIWDSVSEKDTAIKFPADVQQSEDIPNGFNIMISYGVPQTTDAQSNLERMRSTTKTLIGVHLVGESQVIQVGGQPVQEQYSFIARNTDDYLGTSR
jgi:hypothetical protein